jgi:hypothetical protein
MQLCGAKSAFVSQDAKTQRLERVWSHMHAANCAVRWPEDINLEREIAAVEAHSV